ncbi:MAG: GNAT family N-acetyltransferase [Vicinamibacterales bacterium]
MPASDPVSFAPLTASDLPRLHEWLQRPHVREWWEGERTLDEVRHAYLPCIDGQDSTRVYVAHLGGQPVAFLQCYVVVDSGDGWWPDERDPGARGIDLFIADPALLGAGLGRRLLRAFLDSLFADDAVTSVQADPSPDNERAIRCYRAAGFEDAGLVNTPDGPARLMRATRHSLRQTH